MFTRIVGALLIAVAALSSASACPFCKERKVGVFYGDVTTMGNGTIRSWVDVAADGKIKGLGLTFNDDALTGLPETGEYGMAPEWLLKLPKQAAATPFNHIAVNWNPKGHEPKGIYDVPHFDFHFYMIAPTERSLITLEGDDLKVCKKPIPAAQLPKNYVYAPDTEIKYMGAHYVDVTAPELHGSPFTSTFIYGGYDGRLIFVEPMTTMKTIESRQPLENEVKVPAVVAKPGFYPTRYAIRYDASRHETSVLFDRFVWLGAKPATQTARK